MSNKNHIPGTPGPCSQQCRDRIPLHIREKDSVPGSVFLPLRRPKPSLRREKRNISAKLVSHVHQFPDGKAFPALGIQYRQNRGGIAAPAPKPSSHWNSFVNLNRDACGSHFYPPLVTSLEKQGGCPVRQVGFILRNQGVITGNLNPGIMKREPHGICQSNSGHQGQQVMKSIRPYAGDIQEQVDLGI